MNGCEQDEETSIAAPAAAAADGLRRAAVRPGRGGALRRPFAQCGDAHGGGSGGLFQEYREPLGVGRLADGWFVGIGIVRYLLDSSAIRGDLMRHDCPIADNRLPA